MAKKRKAGQHFGAQKATSDRGLESKLRINDYRDVADSEDEFLDNREKILLDEGPEAKRRRKWAEQDEFLQPSDEEVLGFDEDEDEDVDDEEDEYAAPPGRAGQDDVDDGEEPEEEEEEAWGGKQDYYNADAIETEQDALDEEAEALRLQKKQLQGMTEADFAFDEEDWKDTGKADGADAEDEDEDNVRTEVLPQLQVTEDMGPTERLKILKTRYPEFEPLAKEFLDLQSVHRDLSLAAITAANIQRARQVGKNASTSTKQPVAVVKFQALAAYMAALTMYFALLTSTTEGSTSDVLALPANELRDHPVMDSLVSCRTLWNKVKDIQLPDISPSMSFDNELDAIAEEPDSMDISASAAEVVAQPKRTKKSKAQKALEAAQAQAAQARAARIAATSASLADLDALTANLTAKKSAKSSAKPKVSDSTVRKEAADDASDFGDEVPLSKQEAALKAAKKKSLRFYTSQIAQKANKRGAAGRDAGGDADLPYRERLKDRQMRLNAEAEKRGRGVVSQGEMLGGESDEDDDRVARDVRGDAAEDEDYYDMVAARNNTKKQEKLTRSAAEATAAAQGAQLIEREEIGPDGKRKISYAIEKNKGLTPHRKKEVRNPRVKKRKKYEEKMKKLGSVRQVYKGGEGRGGYKGEMTGIKGGVVKSIKL